MFLGQILKSVKGSQKKIPIKGISFNSKKTKKNFIFFAIEGNKVSGTKYIKEAISYGASVIVSEKKIKSPIQKVIFILVKDSRKSLAEASSNFYKKKPKHLVAVTGTNGKSSVADFFYQILSLNKISVASIGTLGILSKNYKKKIKLTSIDSPSLHKNLNILAKNKIEHVILEASSHGLMQKRLNYLHIKTGIFTNLGHDHLDYHKNMKSYLNAKMYLFKKIIHKDSKIITDEDINEYKNIKKIAKKRNIKKITIGSNSGNIKILNYKYKNNKQIVKILINKKKFILEIPLIGFFQIKNLLMAVLAAHDCGVSYSKIFNKIKKIKCVPGRLEQVVKLKNNSNIIIDFAHTPEALENSLNALKKQFNRNILLVFGCGGERDKKKRLIMGKIANKYCKEIFITDDNPRNENPKKIRNEIVKGCRTNAKNIGNRKKAIETAIKNIQPNETLLVAWKGHEQTQDYGNKIINFSDKKVIKEIIKKRKNSINKYNHQGFLLNKAFNINNLKNIKYNNVSINTKNIKKNDLFISIKGKKTDGHIYAKEALNKGAVRSVISKNIKSIPKNKIIRVKNTFLSLSNLAKITRNNSLANIVGITGSVGKTTLKDLTGFILSNYGKVHRSPHSYNNKFGVSLSLSNLKQNTEYGVFEIGMDRKGEIDRLSKIVRPEVGVITNISGAHFKNFRRLSDIAKAKSEIINNITYGGTIVLNKDDSFFNFFYNKAKLKKLNIISFSFKKKADISILSIKKIKNNYKLKIKVKNKIFFFIVSFSTKNYISNVLGCIAIIFALNLDLKKIKKKFMNFKIPSGRGDIKTVKKFKKIFRLVDESYNANPLSMMSAIKNMNYYNGNKKLVFLGDMLELGKKSKKFHRELSVIINKSDIDKVFVYGKYIKETFNYLSTNKKGKIFKNIKEAHVHFSEILHNNDLLMVKGSNATGLNRFSTNIKKGQISAI